MKISRFEELEIWKEARELSQVIVKLTSKSGFSKDYSLKDQIQRSSGSVMDCIAEGFERDGRKEFIQFLSISKGSLGETRSQLYRAFDKHYINETELHQTLKYCEEVARKIASLMKYLKSTPLIGTKNKPET